MRIVLFHNFYIFVVGYGPSLVLYQRSRKVSYAGIVVVVATFASKLVNAVFIDTLFFEAYVVHFTYKGVGTLKYAKKLDISSGVNSVLSIEFYFLSCDFLLNCSLARYRCRYCWLII